MVTAIRREGLFLSSNLRMRAEGIFNLKTKSFYVLDHIHRRRMTLAILANARKLSPDGSKMVPSVRSTRVLRWEMALRAPCIRMLVIAANANQIADSSKRKKLATRVALFREFCYVLADEEYLRLSVPKILISFGLGLFLVVEILVVKIESGQGVLERRAPCERLRRPLRPVALVVLRHDLESACEGPGEEGVGPV